MARPTRRCEELGVFLRQSLLAVAQRPVVLRLSVADRHGPGCYRYCPDRARLLNLDRHVQLAIPSAKITAQRVHLELAGLALLAPPLGWGAAGEAAEGSGEFAGV